MVIIKWKFPVEVLTNKFRRIFTELALCHSFTLNERFSKAFYVFEYKITNTKCKEPITINKLIDIHGKETKYAPKAARCEKFFVFFDSADAKMCFYF